MLNFQRAFYAIANPVFTRRLAAEFLYKDTPQFSEARAISKFACDLFLEEKVDAVDILFTNFISVLNQKPLVRQLLPIGEIKEAHAAFDPETTGAKTIAGASEFLFEPHRLRSGPRRFSADVQDCCSFLYHPLCMPKRGFRVDKLAAV